MSILSLRLAKWLGVESPEMALAILLSFWTGVALIFLHMKLGLWIVLGAIAVWIYVSNDRQASVFAAMFIGAIIGTVYTFLQAIGAVP